MNVCCEYVYDEKSSSKCNSVIPVIIPFSAVMLMVGDRKSILHVEHLTQHSPKILHGRLLGYLAHPGVISGKIDQLNRSRKYHSF